MNSSPRRRWVPWLPALAWAAGIFVLSSQSWVPGPPDGLTDKHGHAVLYGVLALACVHGLVAGRWRSLRGRTVLAAVALAVAYGFSDEWHQSFVPGRTADLADVLADATGAVVASCLAWGWAILLRRRGPGRPAQGTGGRAAHGARS